MSPMMMTMTMVVESSLFCVLCCCNGTRCRCCVPCDGEVIKHQLLVRLSVTLIDVNISGVILQQLLITMRNNKKKQAAREQTAAVMVRYITQNAFRRRPLQRECRCVCAKLQEVKPLRRRCSYLCPRERVCSSVTDASAAASRTGCGELLQVSDPEQTVKNASSEFPDEAETTREGRSH